METIKRLIIVLGINLMFVTALLFIPGSMHYRVWEKDAEKHYLEVIGGDGESYLNQPPKDTVRTVGYPLLLRGFQVVFGKLWFVVLLIFNGFLGVWLFHVFYQLKGRIAWMLVPLGTFTAYMPYVLTDTLFAALFVTAIWQLKSGRFWVHLILIALASLVRPSLAWFFVVIPAVMYFYEYKKRLIILSLPLVFLATSFSPIRNYINHGEWRHSTIMDRNVGVLYEGTDLPKYLYFIDTFKINCVEPHWAMWKTSPIINEYWPLIVAPFILINLGLWIRFVFRSLRGYVNWGDVVILAYIIGPSMFGAMLGRARLPVEWILL